MVDLNLFTDLQLAPVPRSVPEFARLVEGNYLRLCAFLAEHLPRVGTLVAATTLSLYGRYLTESLRRFSKDWPFVLRTCLFVVAVGFGMGTIIATVGPLVAAGLRWVAVPYLVPATLSLFLVIGILAERQGRI